MQDYYVVYKPVSSADPLTKFLVADISADGSPLVDSWEIARALVNYYVYLDGVGISLLPQIEHGLSLKSGLRQKVILLSKDIIETHFKSALDTNLVKVINIREAYFDSDNEYYSFINRLIMKGLNF